MTRTKLLLALTATALLLLLSTNLGCQAVSADLVLFNGQIYTVNAGFEVVEAVAMENGVIIAIGSDKQLENYIINSDKKIDLEGKIAIPGLIDAHAHITGYAASLDKINLVGTTSAEEIAGLVAAKVAEVAPGEWIQGRGWDQNDWEVKEFPTSADLDEVAPENPVVLTRVDGHACWANTAAMELGGITNDTEDPPGGEIIRARNGRATGIFIDRAEGLVSADIPPITAERLEVLMQQAIANCLEAGLTGVHDMGGGTDDINLIKKLIDADKFPFRVYFNYSAGLPNLDELLAAGHVEYGNGKLYVRSVKAFVDGALGSRGAALIEPYSDRPDSTGLIISDKETLQDITERALRANFQVSVHAIGDNANRISLDAYEAALAATPVQDARLRVEHAQILHPDDIGRFKELNVLPSMQPTHCTSDLPWGITRVGEERILGAYAWRDLIDSGVIIPCGSDFPVEQIYPIWGFYSAVTRQHHDGTPEGGYYPDQKMTRKEALKGFTIWAAHAGFMENMVGSIELGKKGDMVILDRNIMTVPDEDILNTKVLTTIVDGKIAFSNEAR